MRFVFLIPDLYPKPFVHRLETTLNLARLQSLRDFVRLKMMPVDIVYGGTLNIMRHCAVAQSCGVEAVLATPRGVDTYGQKHGLYNLPFIRWADRRSDDICLVPDFVSELVDEVQGSAIVYLQVPTHTRNNFNYKDNRVTLWTDSPYMQKICQETFPGKEVAIVPNIIDNCQFPFIPQSEREKGLIFAFPRKGPEFIAQVQKFYKEMGGTYWRFELIDGLSIHELAKQFSRPQAFLASAEIEGCALPPQESMASGIVVIGKTAKGANFCMKHRQTAMTAENPKEAAQCLIELEDLELRDTLSRNAYQHISQYFPNAVPQQFWLQTIAHYQAQTQKEQILQAA